jgi:hypothetical protein
MNRNSGFPNIISCVNLILIILFAHPLSGQQIGTEPVITLISPSATDSLNNKGITLVRAEIISHNALKTFRIFKNGKLVGIETGIKAVRKDSITYVIESLIPLDRGQNIIYIEAKNSISSASSEKRIITSHPEPFVTWLVPASINSTAESGMMTIKAEIKSSLDLLNTSINLNGKVLSKDKEGIPRLNDETYLFETTVQLNPGKNKLYISVTNIKGVTNSTIRYISYSLPIINLVSPSAVDNLNNKGVTLVRAEIVSHSALKTFWIFNNEEIAGSETSTKAVQKDSITYIIESLIPLNRGQNIIYVEAINSIGSASSEKRIITSQPEPFVTWLLPAYVNSTTESGILTIKVEIKTAYDLKNVSINLNGTKLAEDKEGIKRLNNDTYILERSLQLKTGKNSIYIAASNIRGVINSTIRFINYSFGSVPVITLVSPSYKDSLNNKGITLVRAEIISHTALKTFRIFDNEVIVGNETGINVVQKDSITYIKESLIPLNRGQNIIYVEAINPIGSASSERRIITSQLEPFVTWLLPTSANSNSESGMLTITAVIYSDYDLKNVSINLNGNELAEGKEEITRLNDNTYSFKRAIRLNSDKNSIYISTSNTKGVTNSTTRVVNYLHCAAPVITLVRPSAIDSLNNSGIILINAEIISNTELQSVRIFNNRISEIANKLEQKDSITYILKNLVPLQAGINVISVDAKNFMGTASSEKRIIVCQLEPIIKWIKPVTVSSTAESGMLNIKAEIKTNLDLISTSINLNGVADKTGFTRQNNDTYILERTVKLKEGGNSIVLNAVNAKGTAYSNKRNINYVPGIIISEIKWIMPLDTNSNTYKPEFQVSATIKTKSEIKSTHLSLNGTELVSEVRSNISKKNDQEYLYENTLTLKQGINTFELSALTNAGTISSEKRVITYMVPTLPDLVWKNPIPDKSVVNNPSLDIKMNIKSFAKLENIVVYLNGKALGNDSLLNSVKKENGDFVLKNTMSLMPGDNNIYVVAGNVAGKATSEIRNIKYVVPSKPVITWGNPETSVSSLSTATITIKANITSATDLQNLQVFHNDQPLFGLTDINTINKQSGEYRIEKTISLNQGENRLYIVAENNEGNSTSETRSVSYMAPAAPEITWLSPSRQHTDIDLYLAEIRATIKSPDKLQSVLVYVNGKGSEEVNQISPSGSQVEYTLKKVINLQPGENNIYLSVTNNVGTTNSEIRYLTNPTANPPVISWTIPTNDSAIVNSEIVVIEACIKSTSGLRSANILVNGVSMASEMTFQAPQTGECSYILSKSVILKEGDNSVFIIAENFAGSNRSEKRLIRFQKTLAEKRLALVIGNSDYGSSIVLKNPVNDANLMEGTLKNLGFNVIKLINATKIDMTAALRDFSKKLSEYSVTLFYYAGHGVQVNGLNYLIPTDAILKDPGDCKWEAILINDIVEEFEKVPENINIVILDACRDNPFRSWSRGGGAQGFRVMNAVNGTIISYATGENSTAADGSDKNGTFTEELVKQMNIPQSIYQVFNNTRKQVMKRTNNLQRPTESNNLTGDFYFKK